MVVWCSFDSSSQKKWGPLPIAVDEILHHLVSYLCCQFARPYLPDHFLPCGQVGIGILGSLKVAIYAVHHSLSVLGNDDLLALRKIDLKNAFIECS